MRVVSGQFLLCVGSILALCRALARNGQLYIIGSLRASFTSRMIVWPNELKWFILDNDLMRKLWINHEPVSTCQIQCWMMVFQFFGIIDLFCFSSEPINFCLPHSSISCYIFLACISMLGIRYLHFLSRLTSVDRMQLILFYLSSATTRHKVVGSHW